MSMREDGNDVVEQSWSRVPTRTAYREVRENIGTLIGQFPSSSTRTVPACPEWTVHDLVEHLVEICRIGIGLLGGPAHPPPTDDVDGINGLLRSWRHLAECLDEQLGETSDEPGNFLVMDAFTHECDLRRALDAPAPANHSACPTALDTLARTFSKSVSRHHLPALRMETGKETWIAGRGTPAATVRGSHYDLARSLACRRTAGQINELCWSADPAPWLPAFERGPFTLPPHETENLVGD